MGSRNVPALAELAVDMRSEMAQFCRRKLTCALVIQPTA